MAAQKKQNGRRSPSQKSKRPNQAGQPGRTNPTRGNGGKDARAQGANYIYSGHAGFDAYAGFAVKNSGGRVSNNGAGAGVIGVPGRAGDAGRYGDRLRDAKKDYSNKRKNITRGRDLTTPFEKRIIVDAPKKKSKKAAAAAAENLQVKYKYRTVAGKKKNFPIGGLAVVVIISIFLTALIYSYSVLNERSVTINKLREEIAFEIKREKILDRELEIKNDLTFILSYAVDDLQMIKEDLLMKHYVSAKLNDKVEIMGDKNSLILDFPDIMSAIFKK